MKRVVKIIILFILLILSLVCTFHLFQDDDLIVNNKNVNLSDYSIEEIKEYASDNNLKLNISYEYSSVPKDKVIYHKFLDDSNLNVVFSKGVYDEYKISLGMVGDLLIHSSIYGDTWHGNSYKNMLSLVKPLIEEYDIAYYNQESIIGGDYLGLSTYPRFNSPEEVGNTMIDLGFNMVSLANNHTLDKNEIGVINSTKYWKKKNDILTAGSYSSYDDRNNINNHIKEKNNIKYGFLSYTTTTNGLKTPVGKEYLVNVYNDDFVKSDILKIKDKVDVLIVAMHWGVEYRNKPSAEQIRIANYLSELGVDIIIGSHPHVIEPIDRINDTLVIYSLGNFFSGQVGEDKNVGVLMGVDITKRVDKDGSKIKIGDVKSELLYTKYNGYLKNGVWYCSNFKLYPFKNLNNNILNNYKEIEKKYKNIIYNN